MADISATLVSNSTQLDNVDLMSGPRVFTIVSATLNESAEQPLSIKLAEYDRPWKPGLTVRRILSGIWSAETDDWTGRQVRLYRDESVKFGTSKTGGTRISHASHIDKTVTLTLPTSKGKFGEFTVKPLEAQATAPTPPPEPTAEQVAACTDVQTLYAMFNASTDEAIREQIKARKAELEQPADEPEPGLNFPEGGA